MDLPQVTNLHQSELLQEVQGDVCSRAPPESAGGSLLPLELPGCRAQLHRLSQGRRSLSSGTWSSPCPAALPWGLQGCSSHTFSLQSVQCFPPCTHYPRGITAGLSLSQHWVCPGSGWNWLHGCGGSFHPCTKALPCKPNAPSNSSS